MTAVSRHFEYYVLPGLRKDDKIETWQFREVKS